MDEPNHSVAVRAVVWVRNAAWRRSAQALPLRTLAVESGYEALAELLAAPSAALIVELSLLSPRHVRLLEAARGRRIEVLGLGAPHPNVRIEALSGVRLVSPDDLLATLAALVDKEATAPEVDAEDPDDAEPIDDAEQAEDSEEVEDIEEVDEELAAAIEADRLAAAHDLLPPATEPPAPQAQASPPPPEPPPAPPAVAVSEPMDPSPRGLLTREELSALLEDSR